MLIVTDSPFLVYNSVQNNQKLYEMYTICIFFVLLPLMFLSISAHFLRQEQNLQCPLFPFILYS